MSTDVRVKIREQKKMGSKPISPIKAIRYKCLDCCANQANEVAKCPVKECFLYPFRFGKNPYNSKASEATKNKAGIA